MLFLRLLEVPGSRRGGRRTRDGRTPFIAQQELAAWFGMPQPDISRIEKYWLEGDWANLLSLKTVQVLTGELMARIVEVFATFPWWGMERVHRHLREQGVAVSLRQVRQAAEKSFTNLPPELVPYSRYRVETHLLAMQMYGWGYSTYRRSGQALGVAGMTVYRWVSG